jgi:hypothetical protein
VKDPDSTAKCQNQEKIFTAVILLAPSLSKALWSGLHCRYGAQPSLPSVKKAMNIEHFASVTPLQGTSLSRTWRQQQHSAPWSRRNSFIHYPFFYLFKETHVFIQLELRSSIWKRKMLVSRAFQVALFAAPGQWGFLSLDIRQYSLYSFFFYRCGFFNLCLIIHLI